MAHKLRALVLPGGLGSSPSTHSADGGPRPPLTPALAPSSGLQLVKISTDPEDLDLFQFISVTRTLMLCSHLHSTCLR